jgi:hypothetical protein
MESTYLGHERRYMDRTVARQRVVGSARSRRVNPIRSSLISGEWYPVLQRRPGVLLALEDGLPRAGYIWLEVNGKAGEYWQAFLEVEWATS